MDESVLKQAREEINEIDHEMAKLFVRRMQAAKKIAKYKHANNFPILDQIREQEIIKKNTELIDDKQLREFYSKFFDITLSLSKHYQVYITKKIRMLEELGIKEENIDGLL